MIADTPRFLFLRINSQKKSQMIDQNILSSCLRELRKIFSLREKLQYAHEAWQYGFLLAVDIMLCVLGARSPGLYS